MFEEPKRIITLSDGIDAESIGIVQGKIIELHIEDPGKWISLVINSGGGDTDTAFAFYDMMTKIIKPKLETIALAHVASCAIVIFMTGQRRFVSRTCNFFFHESVQRFDKNRALYAKDTEFVLHNLKHENKTYAEIINRETDNKMKTGDVLSLMHEEGFVKPEQLIEYGIAHEII